MWLVLWLLCLVWLSGLLGLLVVAALPVTWHAMCHMWASGAWCLCGVVIGQWVLSLAGWALSYGVLGGVGVIIGGAISHATCDMAGAVKGVLWGNAKM